MKRLIASTTGVGVLVALAAAPVRAADLRLSIELPRLKNRPYVAVWIERDSREHAIDLAVWHEDKSRKGGKKRDKYLPDLRQWWRTGGSQLEMPIDGVTGPTRPAGTHTLAFSSGSGPLAGLAAGSYRLIVEASREDGGDEVMSFPLTWPPRAAQEQQLVGKQELGSVSLAVKP